MTEQYTYDGSKIYDKEGEYLFQGFMELDGVLIAEKLNFQDQEIKNLRRLFEVANILIMAHCDDDVKESWINFNITKDKLINLKKEEMMLLIK